MAKNQRVASNSGENTASKKIHNQVLQLQELKSTNNLGELRRGSCAHDEKTVWPHLNVSLAASQQRIQISYLYKLWERKKNGCQF